MKILHINTYSTSGACIAATRFHLQMLEIGIESKMLFLHKMGYDVSQSFEYKKSEEIPNTFLNRQKLRFLKLLFPNKKTLRQKNELKLLNRIKGFEMFSFATTEVDITTQSIYKEADIIHFHWTGTILDFSFFQKNTKPVVWTLHDMNPFTGGCHYSNGCEKYKTNCAECPQLEGTSNKNNAAIDLQYKIEKLRNKLVFVISPSKWLLSCALQSSIFRNMTGKQIFNCVDFSVFTPQDKTFCRQIFSMPANIKILLFVSDSLENNRKGFDLLINALKQCKSQEIHLCAIGKKPQSFEFDIDISFLGKIKDEKLLSLVYSLADVFVMPSREDNLPNVMIESLACGVPVISFPIGGMVDVVKTGFNGILTKDVSSQSLALAIDDFVSNKYSFNSDAIRTDAMLHFSPLEQTKKYIEVYKSLIT